MGSRAGPGPLGVLGRQAGTSNPAVSRMGTARGGVKII
jgi:hypothetical protein